MLGVYKPPERDKRKIELLYDNCNIASRYSVIPDYSLPQNEYTFYPKTPEMEPFPGLDLRMAWYREHAVPLSIRAIEDCVEGTIDKEDITCLITVSCTGMSAPGLDIHIIQQLKLSPGIQHTSVNYMGCYAAIHALKQADAICRADEQARVLIVCTELCTLHFQKEYKMDHITSSLLFSDGAAAVLVTGNACSRKGLELQCFYSEIALQGQSAMTWELSERGFLMHLDSYIPRLVEENIGPLLEKALKRGDTGRESIAHWAVHPGGKRILENIQRALQLERWQLAPSFHILRHFGNMSSPTILFVLKEIMGQLGRGREKVFAVAFGPGITMETLILESS